VPKLLTPAHLPTHLLTLPLPLLLLPPFTANLFLQPQPKHRLYVCGLRESCKAIKTGKALAVLMAPDIQLGAFGKPDRVLDGRMREIILSSQVPQPGRACVPVVFALSRKKIGQVFGSKKRMSAITLLDVAGVEELYGAVLQLAEQGRQRWVDMNSLH
jgi:ribosomal protein L7Ae-like RNA K-turn-binding protein